MALSPASINAPAEASDSSSQPTVNKYTLDQVQKGLSDGTFAAKPPTDAPSKRRKSFIWSELISVYDCSVEPPRYTNYQKCIHCDKVYCHTTGHAHIKAHVEKHRQQSGLPKAIQVSAKGKELMAQSMRNYIVDGALPFNRVDADGLKKLIACAVKIGHDERLVDLETLLPSRKTVKAGIAHDYKAKQLELFHSIKQHAAKFATVFGIDHYKETFTQTNFVTVTNHSINEKFEPVTRLVECVKFPFVNKTGENDASYVEMLLERIGIDNERIVVISDEGSDFIKACRLLTMEHVSCADHILNTVHRRALKLKDDNSVSDAEVLELSSAYETNDEDAINSAADKSLQKLIHNCDQLVTFSRKGNLHDELEEHGATQLQHFSERRWNGVLFMLKTVYASIDKALELLHARRDKKPYNKYKAISQQDVGDLIEFLIPFQRASDALESCGITLPWVLPRLHSLLLKCKPDSSDSVVTQAVKRRFKVEIERKLQTSITPIHYAATLLHPSFEKASFSTDEQKQTGVEYLKKVMERVATQMPAQIPAAVSEFADLVPNLMTANVDELASYLAEEPPKQLPENVNVGAYWRDALAHEKWPVLTYAAQSILAVPACSASCERVHSCAGRNMTSQRASLDSESLSAVLFVSYYDKAKI